MRLAQRVAVVTGASDGIGAALARSLVREGARVVLAARSQDKLAALAHELGRRNALAVPTDVADVRQVRELVDEAVRRFGGIDVLVNNAGMGLYASVAEMSREKFRRLWEVNFFGVVECTQAALPYLKQRRGTIVNMSSVWGKFAFPYVAGYCATKFALNAFSTSLRMELAGTGVRVVVVCPGIVDTSFQQSALREGEELPAQFHRRHRGIHPERVARETVKAIVRGKREVIVPSSLRLLIGFRNLFPRMVDGIFVRLLR